jgi:ABC-type multidrug transport system fused ATPase/permease subunit
MNLFDLFTMPIAEMFQGFFLPFLIIFVIVWAILNALKVFNKRVNMVLSLSLSLLASSTPQFTLFAAYIAQMGAQVAIVAFGLVFVFGVMMWTFGRGKDIFYEQLSHKKKIEKLMKDRREYLKKARQARRSGNKGKERDYMKRANEIDDILKMERYKD